MKILSVPLWSVIKANYMRAYTIHASYKYRFANTDKPPKSDLSLHEIGVDNTFTTFKNDIVLEHI